MASAVTKILTCLIIAVLLVTSTRIRVVNLKNIKINQDSINIYKSYYKINQIRRIELEEEMEIEFTLLDQIIESTADSFKDYLEANINYKLIDKSQLEKITYQVSYEEEYSDEDNENIKTIMGDASGYSDILGVTCFRGNNYRDTASYGIAKIDEKKLEIAWNISIGGIDRWTGVGWNGQPAIVEYSEELRNNMNINYEKKSKDNLKEVIYATLDGNVYFMDLDDGKETRSPIKIPGPIKGSITIDPRGVPLLYVGQGIDEVHGKKVEIGYRIYSLIDQEKLFFINGRDTFAYRGWAAFDSTALIDKETDTMLICGENGIFYRLKLNTQYNTEENILELNPKVAKYRYKISGNSYQGIENSVAVYKNLAYFADNGGWLQAIDINTLEPVWIRNVTDDTDSTVVIEDKKDEVSLYTGSEVDKQGAKGKSYIRKIDALSGNLIWEKYYLCDSKIGTNPNNGGILATPVVGSNELKEMIIYNIARYGGFNKGLLVALNKNDGEEIWRIELKNYSWSSPVDIYDEDGIGYIIVCDSVGNMFFIKGSNGEILDKINLGSNVEGSPAVFKDMIVVGTRGQKIYGIKIK